MDVCTTIIFVEYILVGMSYIEENYLYVRSIFIMFFDIFRREHFGRLMNG